MAKNVSVTVITEPFILSFPELLAPRAYKKPGAEKPTGTPEFSFEGISELDALKTWKILNRETGEFTPANIEARCVALVREKFGADFDVKGAVASKDLTWPFKSGTKKADDKGAAAEHYRDRKFFRAKAKPIINDRPNEPSLYEASKNGELIRVLRSTEAGKQRINELFYGGAICTAEINIVAQETPQGKFVTLYVNSVVFEKDGDRLGSGSNMERLRGVQGGDTNYDPTEGMAGGGDLDDEIPF